MNEPVITLDDRDSFRTDILHEYFIGPARFPEFVKACQEVIHFDPTLVLRTFDLTFDL